MKVQVAELPCASSEELRRLDVQCEAGYVAIAGGASLAGPAEMVPLGVVQQSFPFVASDRCPSSGDVPTGWTVVAFDPTKTLSLKAYVLCVPLGT